MERTEDSFLFPNTRAFPISSVVGKCFYSFPTLCERLLDMYGGIVCVRISEKRKGFMGKYFIKMDKDRQMKGTYDRVQEKVTTFVGTCK